MKINKECTIDLEVESQITNGENSNSTKRFIMSTSKANLESASSFIANEHHNAEGVQKKTEQIFKIAMDGSKLKGKW